ncbi:hypothetical protein GDO86_011832 [Hymenochirus boettgeri]|uniref:tRNA-dihydrouridine(47) synthase [NAD(P)(+)] n=1 Tax=Hymenochirus boettgeri TaxID=247094 RepID=A0A8T2JFT8_9PIPI|nr:hypothetical protein GDO86_011832 [Hymenochirus boettgeri]KAG8443173.1 hypothetical protein GDO86_011832 [Hymenochirus boettgeri]
MAENNNSHSENGKLDAVPNNFDRGVAAIKPQYLTTKEKFHILIDADGKEKQTCLGQSEEDTNKGTVNTEDAVEPEAKRIKLDDESSGFEEKGPKPSEGKQGKKRARGQNKSRPHMKHSQFEENKLCPSITQECTSKCFFGENCKFLHDVSKYFSAKPEDISPHCYLYDTFGRCMYGVTCRFAKSHLGENFKNLVNEERMKQWEGKVLVKNNLDKDLKQQLRKKKVVFEKADEYLKIMNKSGNSKMKNPGSLGTGPSDMSKCQDDNIVKQDGPVQVTADSTMGCSALTIGVVTDEDIVKLRPSEKKTIDFRNKLYLAPLTTCGNLPFRRICKQYGADITCGEMAMCTNLLQGHPSEWALLKRHHTEDIFGVQLEGAFPDTLTKCAELLNRTIDVDFVDINVGCPIDLVYKKGGGCGLMTRMNKFEQIVKGMNYVLDVPLTVKIRTGVQEKANIAHKIIPNLRDWGVSLVTIHGRSREQRYTKLADWEYIEQCAKIADPLPLFGNGDILSYEDANRALQTGVSGIMLARGALVKPWLFTEIKEQRHWDISSAERFDILKDFTNYGLEHWGSDSQGVEKTRRFLLEWLSFLCRYIPVGLLEHVPQKINERPPYYMGRDYLETLMASQNVTDWIKMSEMLLGPVPPNFTFLPKHKANSYK